MNSSNKNEITFLGCCPLAVSSREGESDAEFKERWNRIGTLSQNEKDLLSSEFAISEIYDLAINFSFSVEEAADVARLVRAIVWGDIKKEQLDMILGKHFSRLGVAEISKIKDVILKILSQRPEDTKEKDISIKMPLADALRKFPNLGEQLITSAPLKLRIFPEMVKPSIKNWIADYQDALGRGKHGMMERGNYLFHGENTKRLTSLERKRLTEILKSLDDGSELPIDTQGQKVAFENRTQEYDAPAQKQIPESLAKTELSQQPQTTQRIQQAPIIKKELYKPEIQSNSVADKGQVRDGSLRPAITPPPVLKKETKPQRFVQWENPLIANIQDHYEIPKKRSEEAEPIKNSWNPAESVRMKMAEENSTFGSSQISHPKPEAAAQPQGSIRFSSPQTLPVEKKQEALKPLPPNTYASTPRPNQATPAFIPKPPVSSPPKPAPAVASRPSFPITSSGEDDLMAKMRALKKQAGQKSAARPIYKITPMGFVKKSEEELRSDDEEKGPKVSGNVVDLRK